ncbi:MAG: serine hydrolase domain-containing protein [Henriciella sp.]|nr:serine hydrolase domain-containing protein [Henriciella sp.]
MIKAWLTQLTALVGGLLLISGAALAQDPAEPTAPPPSPLPGLEDFVDGVMQGVLRDRPIPGAVVAIVKDGEIQLLKGYGYADLENKIPVDPERSLFRIASISKLFVGMAVMQLVEQDLIDLDADINTYLGTPLTLRFDTPVTVRHLLTHTGGFEHAQMGIFTDSKDPTPTLQQVIDTTMPEQAFEPGLYPAYSNHGFVVLGRIVEEVSGLSYDDYVEQHVMAPIGMTSSSAHQPVPGALADQVVTSYSMSANEFVPQPFEIVAASPGGAISATGLDMARYAIAALKAERSADIVSAASFDALQSVQFRVDPRVMGMGFSFPVQNLEGRPAWYHTGGLMYASSRLTALSEEDFAVFTAFNTGGPGHGAGNILWEALIDHYFPMPAPGDFPTPPPQADMQKYEGAYQTSGSFYHSFPALSAATGQTVVEATGDGELTLSNQWGTTVWRWVAEDRFRRPDSADTSGFGDLLFLFEDGATHPYASTRFNQTTRINLRQTGWRDFRVAESMLGHGRLIGKVLAVVLLILAGVALLRRKWFVAAANAATLLGLMTISRFLSERGILAPNFSGLEPLSLEMPPELKALLMQPTIALSLVAVGAALAGFAIWRGPRLDGRAGLVFLTTHIATIGLWIFIVLFLQEWRLLFA